jgi:hypothetical protein
MKRVDNSKAPRQQTMFFEIMKEISLTKDKLLSAFDLLDKKFDAVSIELLKIVNTLIDGLTEQPEGAIEKGEIERVDFGVKYDEDFTDEMKEWLRPWRGENTWQMKHYTADKTLFAQIAEEMKKRGYRYVSAGRDTHWE